MTRLGAPLLILLLTTFGGCAATPNGPASDAPLELLERVAATTPLAAKSVYSFAPGARHHRMLAGAVDASSVHTRRATSDFDAQCRHDEDGQRSEFWVRDEAGNIAITATVDRTDNAITVYQPPLTIAWAELSPGDVRESTAEMRVVDLRRVSRQIESGTATRRVRYAEDQRIRTPLGEFLAHRYEVRFTFDLQKADGLVESTLFIVPEYDGPVAEVRRGTITILGIIPRHMEQLLVLEEIVAAE